MLTFRKCHNLQNSLLIIKKVFIWCYSAGQIQNKKSIREYLKGLKRQPLSRENKGEWFGMRYLLGAIRRLWIPPAKFDIFIDEKKKQTKKLSQFHKAKYLLELKLLV